ncbi:MAG: hypothetical protein K0S32_65 [Bacteroidetes bacterium]|nr:hypothetical protein [Bacteroidota bacterium]
MKINYALPAIFIICTSAFSQQINWAKNTPLPANSKGLLTDNNNNIYNYGSSLNISYGSMFFSLNGMGSFLNKYDANGNLQFSKTYTGQFDIQKIVYDNISSFYFTGVFAGTHSFNGVTITSKGNADAMIGKMDLNGNINWMVSLGGRLNDIGSGVTMDPVGNTITITGGLSDSLWINNSLVAPAAEKTLLMARFTSSGSMQSVKQIDFLPGRNEVSCGSELYADNQGNYILHGYREGKHWYNDSVTCPDDGNYVFKMDNAFNILWSKFIISSSCYYGYTCGGLGVKNNGESYMASFCSGKYGGTPALQRLNAVNGSIAWAAPDNSDGHYNLAYATGDDVFILGEEGVYTCPCAYGHGGYAVIKKFNSLNQLQGETRIKNVNLTGFVKTANGNLYASGNTTGNYFKSGIGNDSVQGDFLISLTDIRCAPVTIDTNKFWLPGFFCDTLKLDAGAGYSNYLWSNGNTGRFMQTTKEGWYSCQVTQTTGCMAHSIGSWGKKPVKPESTPIQYVTYDNNLKKNVVAWNFYMEDPYNVMPFAKVTKTSNGLTVSDTYTGFGYPVQFKDTLDWADTAQVAYKLTMENFCNDHSDSVPAHKTMFLKMKKQGSVAALEWTSYEGFAYSSFTILRGTTPFDLQPLTEVGKQTVNTFTDNASFKEYYYQVKASKNNQVYSLSNYVHEQITGIEKQIVTGSKFSLYPNPADNEFYLKTFLDKAMDLKISVYDVRGAIVHNELITEAKGEINKKFVFNVSPGIYFMEVNSGTHKEIMKVVKR